MQLGGVGRSKRIYDKLIGLQLVQPFFNQPEHGSDIQMLVNGGIFLQIRLGEFEQSCRRAKAVLLQVNESARQLDHSLVKGMVRTLPIGQPEFFQNIMRFVE